MRSAERREATRPRQVEETRNRLTSTASGRSLPKSPLRAVAGERRLQGRQCRGTDSPHRAARLGCGSGMTRAQRDDRLIWIVPALCTCIVCGANTAYLLRGAHHDYETRISEDCRDGIGLDSSKRGRKRDPGAPIEAPPRVRPPPRFIRFLAIGAALTLHLGAARHAFTQCGSLGPGGPVPNVLWGFKDSVAACAAGDSLIGSSRPATAEWRPRRAPSFAI